MIKNGRKEGRFHGGCTRFPVKSWKYVYYFFWNKFLDFLLWTRHELASKDTAIVQTLSRVWLFATPWAAAHQGSLSFTISQSLLKLMSIESVIPSNHLILCRPLLLLPSVFPSIRIFSNELAYFIRWPRYWNFNISPSNKYSEFISFSIDWFDLLADQGTIRIWKYFKEEKKLCPCSASNLMSMCQTHRQKTLLSERLMVLSAVFGGTGVGEEEEFLHGQVGRCWQDHTLQKVFGSYWYQRLSQLTIVAQEEIGPWVPAVFLLPSLLKYPQSYSSTLLSRQSQIKEKTLFVIRQTLGTDSERKYLKLSVFCIYKNVKFDFS